MTPLGTAAPARLDVLSLGRVEHGEAMELQRRLAAARREGRVGDLLLLLEHPAVVTLGRRAGAHDLLASARSLERLGVALARVDRGGRATYHGPGQLVGYPVLDVRRPGGPRRYVQGLEEALVRCLGDMGLPARREAGLTGVWVEGRKVAAIGVHVSGGITTHGFALNVDPDLDRFRLIVPCGLPDREVTSLARELGRPVALHEAETALVPRLAEVFGHSIASRREPPASRRWLRGRAWHAGRDPGYKAGS